MAGITNTTRAFGSVRRYIQGPGEIRNLKKYVSGFGASAYVLISHALFERLCPELEALEPVEVRLFCDEFHGEVTEELLLQKTARGRETGAACVVGIGGGKCADTARAVAGELKLPCILSPSIASTDAPVSSMSVVFEPDGTQKRIIRYVDFPEMVVVDSQIIADAPARYFSAGIGDALATCYEARQSASGDHPNFVASGYRKTLAGMAVCEACERTVWEKGPAALRAVELHLVTPDVEDVIEANTLLSGLGFINVGLGGAHATNTGLTVLKETAGALHGELVSFGILVQFVLEQRPEEERNALMNLLCQLKLPITLEQLGIREMTEEMLAQVSEKAAGGFWTRCPFLVTPRMVGDAILMADAYGRRFLEKHTSD